MDCSRWILKENEVSRSNIDIRSVAWLHRQFIRRINQALRVSPLLCRPREGRAARWDICDGETTTVGMVELKALDDWLAD